MASIKVELGGKGVGLADQAFIEPAKGCANKCVGCYAAKTTRMGSRFSTVELKEYDHDVFSKSCRAARKKGIRFVRMAKHTDPGIASLRGRVIQILRAAQLEGLQIVFVTKSLEFDPEVVSAMRDGNHILHISLGMITEGDDVPMSHVRLTTGLEYASAGVNTKWRIIDDVTKKLYSGWRLVPVNSAIITPMRFPSMDTLKQYNADPENYEFIGGYYRPKFIHQDWNIFNPWCGEVGSDVKCCNCLVR